MKSDNDNKSSSVKDNNSDVFQGFSNNQKFALMLEVLEYDFGTRRDKTREQEQFTMIRSVSMSAVQV